MRKTIVIAASLSFLGAVLTSRAASIIEGKIADPAGLGTLRTMTAPEEQSRHAGTLRYRPGATPRADKI